MYKNPFIVERADPYITKGSDGYYYFTASYPAYLNVDSGYDRIILRRSKTVEGLSSAEEKEIWHAHSEGIMSKHIWAPEIHEICGKWYIFFAAGNSDDVWHIRPYMLKLEVSDPINDKWVELGKVKATEGDNVSFNSFSLDMTYYEHNNKHYLIWAEIIGDSSLFMAEINPEEPNQLISSPILLTKPEYDWEKVFLNWYNAAYGGVEQDKERIDELNDALWEAGITNLKETWNARKSVMTKVIDEIIEDWIWQNETGLWNGSYNYLNSLWIIDVQLASDLGLDRDIIKQLIYNVAISKGFTKYKNQDAYYLKRLRK